ncbi:PEP-CTERM sorting domain-containing protein [Methylophilus sp. YYY-1]|jgi:hypothetical protein|uniref:PEP-CTERM sorting domain-containing protein n=1 Tax=Methylophilus sp. YYY-1 TaxID=2682087 RepID=UPI0023B233B4|nr:PEP-CTERM sorting domain-containing protein [Methylophilus sp. YYY-1]MDF0378240.1 PEP-CTERM sorting domain-containing protein [Methylophilus sp. YYY-1]
MASTIKKAVLAASIALISFNAQATLTSYDSQGVEVVYSSISNVTWTKDANLLGSLMTSQGFNNVVNNIIAASPVISNMPNYWDGGTGSYSVTASDFSTTNFGRTSWYGAMAFVNYLNTVNYAGSSAWRLPTVTVGQGYLFCWNNCTAGYNVYTNGVSIGNEYAELYYKELGSLGREDIYGNYQPNHGLVDPLNKFNNEQSYVYWLGTQDDRAPSDAWYFTMNEGVQSVGGYKAFPLHASYAWAVTSGRISTIPEPRNYAMLMAGLGLLGIVIHRKKQA